MDALGLPSRTRLLVGAVALVLPAAAFAPALLGNARAAPRPTTFVISAKGGKLQGHRLMLRGVAKRVTWVSHGEPGRSGLVSITRLHRRLFAPFAPPGWPGSNQRGPAPTAALQIAGDASTEVAGLKLRRPRYNASRHMVGYRVTTVRKRGQSQRAARASGISTRRFGRASLSIVALGSPLDIYHCSTSVINGTYYTIEASGEGKWDTDTWNPGIPFQDTLLPGAYDVYGTDGGAWRGCGNSSTWTIVDGPPGVQGVTFSFNTTIPYNGETPGATQGQCQSSSTAFKCDFDEGSSNTWYMAPASNPG